MADFFATNKNLVLSGGGGGSSWDLAGNTLSGGEFLGSLNNFDVNLISNNNVKMTLASATGLGVVAGRGSGVSMGANALGSFAVGEANGGSSVIFCDVAAEGAFSGGRGYIGTIRSLAPGSFTFGVVRDGGTLTASADGAAGTGSVVDATTITASGDGSRAHGATTDAGSEITAGGAGGVAEGTAQAGGILETTASGAKAGGFSRGIIRGSGPGALAHGFVASGGDILEASGEGSQAFGTGHTVGSDYALVSGAFASVVGSPGSPLSTDTLLAAGNGSSGSPSNAIEVARDGKVTTSAAQAHKAINVYSDADSPVSVSERTDRTLIADNAAGAVTFNLPAGEEGLEFLISATSSALANNVVLVADGADTFQTGGGTFTFATGANAIGAHIQFTGGVWYFLSYYQV